MTSFFRFVIPLPVYKQEIQSSAPKQEVTSSSKEACGEVEETLSKERTFQGYIRRQNTSKLDHFFDALVKFSGSEFSFFFINSILLAWAFMGIRFGNSSTWQSLISDVQAILTYGFDSLLMRQQLLEYSETLIAIAEITSRLSSHQRMLNVILENLEQEEIDQIIADFQMDKYQNDFAKNLPPETWFGRACTKFAHIFGHIITIFLYWVGIFIWIGFGHYCNWSTTWQLYINSATSALMIFVFTFIANIRERHAQYSILCLDHIYRIDAEVESELRRMSGDDLDNELTVIPPIKANTLQKIVFVYADMVGTLIGIFALFLVLVIWIAVGHTMKYDSNWWLFIGTYAGLIGLNDGFVLRNVQGKLTGYTAEQFNKISYHDMQLFDEIGLPDVTHEDETAASFGYQFSISMNRICGHEITAVMGFALMMSLVIVSSALKWSFTGQLISNVPPSIIESFFMLILITGHNASDHDKREELNDCYRRRVVLLDFVRQIEFYKSC